jgi:hypothetical protein
MVRERFGSFCFAKRAHSGELSERTVLKKSFKDMTRTNYGLLAFSGLKEHL